MARRGSHSIAMNTPDDLRRYAPATLRNREPILDILRDILPASGLVLELASGSGEHIVHFARQLPGLSWQPSDPSRQARQSIAAWIGEEGLSNVLPQSRSMRSRISGRSPRRRRSSAST
jgi:tRNA G46 methylase TrmB